MWCKVVSPWWCWTAFRVVLCHRLSWCIRESSYFSIHQHHHLEAGGALKTAPTVQHVGSCMFYNALVVIGIWLKDSCCVRPAQCRRRWWGRSCVLRGHRPEIPALWVWLASRVFVVHTLPHWSPLHWVPTELNTPGKASQCSWTCLTHAYESITITVKALMLQHCEYNFFFNIPSMPSFSSRPVRWFMTASASTLLVAALTRGQCACPFPSPSSRGNSSGR